MKIIAGVMVGIACLLSGLLGLTAGINLNPETTIRYVPDWEIAGAWVSGLGALAAVWTMVWTYYRQRSDALKQRLDDEKESLEIVQKCHPAGILTTLSIISLSAMRIVIKDIRIRDVASSLSVRMPMRDAHQYESPTGLRLPARLEFRDVIHFDLDVSRIRQAAVELSKETHGIWGSLLIDIETSTGKVFSADADAVLLKEFNLQRAERFF